MKLGDLVNLKMLLFMYKAKKTLLPINLQKFCILSSSDKQLKDFKSKTVRTTLKQTCFLYGVKLRNSLDEDLKKCATLFYKKKKEN